MAAILAPTTLLNRVSVSAGRAVIRVDGKLVRIEEILAMVSSGTTYEEIARAFPGIEPDDIAVARLHDLELARATARRGALALAG